jgi:hypothetical protein
MKRAAALIALLSTSCATMEPKLGSVDPAIPASWPVGSPYLAQSEAALPAVTYKQIFTDPRLQTLIGEALTNNRDLMAAAANIAAAREQYRVQRAQQFPQLNAGAGVTVTGERSKSSSGSGSGSSSGNSGSGVSASYTAGLNVPNFEVDLFGRLRSLTHAQFERYLATEAGARSNPARGRNCTANRSPPGAGDPEPGAGEPRAAAHARRPGRQRAAAAGRRSSRLRPTPAVDRAGRTNRRRASCGYQLLCPSAPP